MDYYRAKVESDPIGLDWAGMSRQAFKDLAKIAPRHIGYDETHKVGVARFRRGSHHLVQLGGSSLNNDFPTGDWGVILACLIEICDKHEIQWRVQSYQPDDANAPRWKACTSTGWFTGRTPGEALLYALVTSNLALKVCPGWQAGMI